MVDIVVGGVPPAQKNPNERQNQRRPPPEKKRPLKDRRANEEDRRQEARYGVVVTISGRNERREGTDRRKIRTGLEAYFPVDA